MCAKGGGRFAGRVHAAMFWGQPRGGSHEDGSDGKEPVGGMHTEWVDGAIQRCSFARMGRWEVTPRRLFAPNGSLAFTDACSLRTARWRATS